MAEKDNFFVKNKSIITFLILEVVALTAFNFGNLSYIFGIAGGLLAIAGFVFVFNVETDKKSLLWLLLPIGLLLITSILGSFNPYSKRFIPISNISLLVALPSFFAIGFFLRKIGEVKQKIVLLVVGAGLAAITFFGLVSTVIEYGFFYSLIYKKTPNYFFNGMPYDVRKEMYWLSGFEFGEVFIEYGSVFAILCGAFLPGLLFISPKEERNEFIVSLVIGCVGLLTLLIIPNLKALLVLALASSFAFIYKYLSSKPRVIKIIGGAFMGVVGLGILFFILALVNAAIGFKFDGILARVFVNNEIMANPSKVFAAIFQKGGKNILGLQPYVSNDSTLLTDTHIFEVELLKEVGVPGAFLFIGFVLMMGYFMYKYIRKSEDSKQVKTTLIVMILSFFAFASLSWASIIAPHNELSYVPFLRSSLLLVMLFLLGYIYMPPVAEKEIKHE